MVRGERPATAGDSATANGYPLNKPSRPVDQVDSLVEILNLIRTGESRTRPQLVQRTGLGRNVVAQRVAELLGHRLITEGTLGVSTGGRAPRELNFRKDSGHILVAVLGASSLSVAIADLAGNLRGERTESADIADGPDILLQRIDQLFAELLEHFPADLWGIGIGIPGPVEFSTGRPVAPPIMPGWDGYDVRGFFASRHRVPVWVDNDANVMALGEFKQGAGHGEQDVIYVKVGTGIGAGLISNGRMHRGAQGAAGDIGHIQVLFSEGGSVRCRCGNINCLEAIAGGAAIARDAAEAAMAGRSTRLAAVLEGGRPINAAEVAHAAAFGDELSVSLLVRSAKLLGEHLASMVNFFNPAVIIIGGGVSNSGDAYLANVRLVVIGRSLPLATRSLRIIRSSLGAQSGPIGAAHMVADELFSRTLLDDWIHTHPASLTQFAG